MMSYVGMAKLKLYIRFICRIFKEVLHPLSQRSSVGSNYVRACRVYTPKDAKVNDPSTDSPKFVTHSF